MHIYILNLTIYHYNILFCVSKMYLLDLRIVRYLYWNTRQKILSKIIIL